MYVCTAGYITFAHFTDSRSSIRLRRENRMQDFVIGPPIATRTMFTVFAAREHGQCVPTLMHTEERCWHSATVQERDPYRTTSARDVPI